MNDEERVRVLLGWSAVILSIALCITLVDFTIKRQILEAIDGREPRRAVGETPTEPRRHHRLALVEPAGAQAPGNPDEDRVEDAQPHTVLGED